MGNIAEASARQRAARTLGSLRLGHDGVPARAMAARCAAYTAAGRPPGRSYGMTRTLYVLATGVALLFVVLQTRTVTVLEPVTWADHENPSPG